MPKRGKGSNTSAPAPPKKPLTGFFLYKQDVYEQTKKENPEVKMPELTKIISEKWKKTGVKIREDYEKKSEIAKEKYQKELKLYEEKYGPIEKKKRSKGDENNTNNKDDDSDDVILPKTKQLKGNEIKKKCK